MKLKGHFLEHSHEIYSTRELFWQISLLPAKPMKKNKKNLLRNSPENSSLWKTNQSRFQYLRNSLDALIQPQQEIDYLQI